MKRILIILLASVLTCTVFAQSMKTAKKYYKKGEKYEAMNDPAETYRWFRKSAELGYAKAQYQLHFFYFIGDSLSLEDKELTDSVEIRFIKFAIPLKDDTEALRWLRMAAEQGHKEAQRGLACLYKDGDGVTQDYAEAAQWYQKAAKQGDEWAQCELGKFYRDGHGVPQDYSKAFRLFSKSAKQGWTSAQYELAVCYEKGLGVTKNIDKAIHWYRKAAEQGDYSSSKEALKRLGQ